MAYLQACLQRFENLPDDIKDRVGSLEAFKKIEKIEETYGVDLKFLLVLISIGEIDFEDIPTYLQTRHSLAGEDAYEIKNKIEEEFFYPYFSASEDSLLEKEEISGIIKDNLARLLIRESGLEEEIALLNQSIFFHLADDGLFQEELVKNLVENVEKITNKSIIIDDRPTSPTISNWIKDFLKFHGADIFNDLILIQYLNRGENVKLLNVEEKEILKKVLKTYRNLNFFPESLENLPIEDWEMIPLPKESESNRQIIDVLDGEKNIVKEKIDENNYSQQEGDNLNSADAKLIELKKTLANYSISSLEYKAVAQEINRLEKLEKNR